ncbi:MAG: hypothetical protein WA912_12130 [Ornithinimicrobium sp.]
MRAEGTAMVGFQPIEGLNTFRRLLMSPSVAAFDVDAMLDVIAGHGHDVIDR